MSKNKEIRHLHRTHPIIFGGDPEDEDNIVFVSRMEHAELSTFWNNKILESTSPIPINSKHQPSQEVSRTFPVTIEISEALLKVEFPNVFRAYLKSSDGVVVNMENQYLDLWGLEELVQLNEAYHVEDFAPQLLFFGSDGAEEAFAFERSTMHIVKVPIIGMGYVAIEKIADSFTDFLESYVGTG